MSRSISIAGRRKAEAAGSGHPEVRGATRLKPLEVERDAMGWPTAFWRLAGSTPDFDLDDRRQPHERGDVLAARHRRR